LFAARAGLLDGHSCTTHYLSYDELRVITPRAVILGFIVKSAFSGHSDPDPDVVPTLYRKYFPASLVTFKPPVITDSFATCDTSVKLRCYRDISPAIDMKGASDEQGRFG
jgi:hypothetical protein